MCTDGSWVESRAAALRAATPQDAFAIVEIQMAAWMHAYRGILPDTYLDSLPHTRQRKVERWQDLLAGTPGQTMVAGTSSGVLGFASAGPGRDRDVTSMIGELYALYVAPSATGQGIGTALLADAVARQRARACHAMTLWVLRDNLHARHFYEASGWYADGAEATETDGDCTFHDVRYRLVLGPETDGGERP